MCVLCGTISISLTASRGRTVGPVESDGVANEVHSHGIQAVFLVQSAHGHLVQIVALVRLGVPVVITLHKPAQRANVFDYEPPQALLVAVCEASPCHLQQHEPAASLIELCSVHGMAIAAPESMFLASGLLETCGTSCATDKINEKQEELMRTGGSCAVAASQTGQGAVIAALRSLWLGPSPRAPCSAHSCHPRP